MSPGIAAELTAIHHYIALDSPQAAATFVERLLSAIQSLSTFPHRHRQTHGARQPSRGARMMPVSPYLIFYRVDDREKVVRILTVRHGARRRPRRFD